MPAKPGVPVLDRRTLNRTLLGRQFLLERVERPAEDVIEHLVGMQAIELEEAAGRAFAFIAPEVETRGVDIVPASWLPAS